MPIVLEYVSCGEYSWQSANPWMGAQPWMAEWSMDWTVLGCTSISSPRLNYGVTWLYKRGVAQQARYRIEWVTHFPLGRQSRNYGLRLGYAKSILCYGSELVG